MDIGTEKPMIVIEPIEDPLPRRSEPSSPEPSPAVMPEREEELVPA